MSQVSINNLSELTGKDRRTIKRLIAQVKADSDGKFDSKDALETIYYGKKGEDEQFVPQSEAYRRLTIRKDAEIALDMEIKRKERIPLVVCEQVDDETFQSIAAVLKSRKGKRLDESVINEIFELMRDIPKQRKW